MKLTNKKGFTLIELIIVIAILGIIALIAIPNLAGIRQRSQVSADKRTAEQIGKAVRIWATDVDAAGSNARAIPEEATLYTASKGVSETDYKANPANYPLYKLTPDYISDGYTAKSHGTSVGKFYVASIGNGTNNANQKIVVGIASDGKAADGTTALATGSDDHASLTITRTGSEPNIVESVSVDYNGGAAGWAYLEQ